jgi:hypothetical protein
MAVSLLAAIDDACRRGSHDAIGKQVRRALGAVIFSINFKLGVLDVDPGKGQEWLTGADGDRLKAAFSAPFDEIHGITGAIGERRVVVLVDDLDRCSPRRIVDVLEAINVMMDIPGLVFVLALDYDILVRALEDRYPQVSGHAFVEKLVQIPFRVPPLVLDSESILHDLIPGFALRPQLLALFMDICANALNTNPRQIKRLYNLYLVLCRITNISDDASHQQLLVILGLQLGWPPAYRDFQDAVYANRVSRWHERYAIEQDDGLIRYIEHQLRPHMSDEGALYRTVHLAASVTAPEAEPAPTVSDEADLIGDRLTAVADRLAGILRLGRFSRDHYDSCEGRGRWQSSDSRLTLQVSEGLVELYEWDPRSTGTQPAPSRKLVQYEYEDDYGLAELELFLRDRVQRGRSETRRGLAFAGKPRPRGGGE